MSGSQFPMGGQGCQMCGEVHSVQTGCSRNALIHRIKVMQENIKLFGHQMSAIKPLMEANHKGQIALKESQALVKHLSNSISLIEATVKSFKGGEELWAVVENELEKMWVNQPSNQDTAEPQQLSFPENTTQSETESKPCTETTTNGETTAQSSSQSTPSATPAEPKLLS